MRYVKMIQKYAFPYFCNTCGYDVFIQIIVINYGIHVIFCKCFKRLCIFSKVIFAIIES
jgi:hypothetical protein